MARDHVGGFELMVLIAVIRTDQNAYGVTIGREIERQSGRSATLGSVYAALDRLQAKSLVTSDTGDPTPERGGRAKRYFRVTARGLREARKARRALMKMWRGLPQLEGGRA